MSKYGEFGSATFFVHSLEVIYNLGVLSKVPTEYLVNEKIRASQVQVVSSENKNLGTVKFLDAFRMAAEAGLDLVQINNDDPPLCKILDYDHFRYELQKRRNGHDNHNNIVQNKEIRFRLNIAAHDIETKKRQVQKWIDDNNNNYKIKLRVNFRAREMAQPERGMFLLKRFVESLTNVKIDIPPKFIGRSIEMMISHN